MILKTYRARTMGDALAEVKRDLGKDAVILHTRSYRVGGWLGFGGRPMVEITASDGVNVLPRERKKGTVPTAPAPRPVVIPAAAMRAYGMPPPAENASARPERAATRAAELVPVAASAGGAGGSAAAAVVEAIASPARGAKDGVTQALDAELAAIKKMVGQVLQCSRQSAVRAGTAATAGEMPGSMPDALFTDYLKLLEGEVAAEIAEDVVGQVRNELSPAELADGGIVRQTVLRHLASMIPAEGDVPRLTPPRDGRPLTLALVGPTGVGKTTTVAKLAAAYKLRHGKRVGLVTTDTYRIAAVDQLRTYAEIIGLPLRVAMSPAEMGAVLEGLRDCEVVLIDTAGRSQRDAGRLDELRRFLAAARPHHTHLVLSSTASEAVLLEAAERFAAASPDRVIFTKLDEAVNFGVLVTVASRIALKLSYVTTGQEVPDHIEIGSPDRIARLLLEGGKAR
ncbi:MAG: flagellar biosynthesis protein FlhF [Phycisphaerales bacterium]